MKKNDAFAIANGEKYVINKNSLKTDCELSILIFIPLRAKQTNTCLDS